MTKRSLTRGFLAVATVGLMFGGTALFSPKVKAPASGITHDEICKALRQSLNAAIDAGPESGPGHAALVAGKKAALKAQGCTDDMSTTTTAT